MSLDFHKDFILYTFATDFFYTVVQTQKYHDDAEIPIYLMSSKFKGAELNYSQIDKQDHAVYKSVKNYRLYMLKLQTKVIVPYAAIRNVLIQK